MKMKTLNLVKAIESGDTKSADFAFQKAIAEKVQTALKIRRVAVAGEIYNKISAQK